MNNIKTIREALKIADADQRMYYANSRQAENVAKAFKALDALEKRLEWQPIETAPKKGRDPIYIWGPNYTEPQKAYPDTYWTAGFSVETKPTHWQPLPQPPKEGEQ